ncbi:ABC transporter ATP-binding protein [Meiothermus rufus]|uniref:ABC transporter ATP-binding protein n=1 Tax=Meiothermus rufus TaxID=604332 RepID=UPI0003F74795|nr:ABC transporter ATP-binding protein [Meiothermus rufus]
MEDLRKSFPPREVLRGLNLRLKPGEVLGLLGLNGAGKTTLIKLLAGLLTPDGGSIRLLGQPTSRALIRKAVALMKEGQPSLYEFMTPRQNLRYFGHLLGISNLKERVEEALELTGLQVQADKPVLQLSFGTKRRVGLALAYLKEAPVLLMDEASAGLDVRSVAEMRNTIRRYASLGRAVLLTGHEMGFLEAVCDCIAVLHAGRIVVEGRLAELVQRLGLQPYLEVWCEDQPAVGEVLSVEAGLFRTKVSLGQAGHLNWGSVRHLRLQQSPLERLLQEDVHVEG